jgi:CelD/BcsL family acetyltransferase involved in cellulose biosynthesis
VRATIELAREYGAPILSDPRSHAFYTRLARASAAAGRFALYLLKLQDRLIAFEYCLRAQRKIDLLKPSYDPELAKFSPGNVLRWLILQHEIALGEIDSYHLGRSSDWKKHWVTRTEPLTRLRIYGPGFRSRLAYHGGPRLRAAVKRLPGVHRVYHALRR